MRIIYDCNLVEMITGSITTVMTLAVLTTQILTYNKNINTPKLTYQLTNETIKTVTHSHECSRVEKIQFFCAVYFLCGNSWYVWAPRICGKKIFQSTIPNINFEQFLDVSWPNLWYLVTTLWHCPMFHVTTPSFQLSGPMCNMINIINIDPLI